MSRSLTSHANLEALRKEAKRWLKALRAQDAAARERLLAATPAAPAPPTLRDVQLALAREYGFAGWAALKQAVSDMELAKRSRRELADEVLRHACFSGEHEVGARIYAKHPEIADLDLYIASAAGHIETVRKLLAADPTAAARKGGPKNWEPLLYLTFLRLPGAETHAVEIARLLLDHGADANASWRDDWENGFTALTGVIALGEGVKPPHPRADELAALLIERGADPFDKQSFYNTSIVHDDTHWLDFLWSQCEAHGETGKWRDVSAAFKIGGRVPVNILDFMLGLAVANDHKQRAAWLLAHGADANGVHAYSGRRFHEEALHHGNMDIANLLARHGAIVAPLEGAAAFQPAVMQMDRETAQRIAAQYPDILREAAPMLNAAHKGRIDIVQLLLDLGMDVDVMDATEQRALHNAVMGGSLDLVKLLVAHGADIDRPTLRFGGPMGFAAHFARHDIAAWLAPLSRDVHEMVYLGLKDRLSALFDAEPALVNLVYPRGCVTPLFCLPDNDDAACEMAAFLLAHGADPALKNAEGLIAEEVTRKRGLEDAADLLKVDDD